MWKGWVPNVQRAALVNLGGMLNNVSLVLESIIWYQNSLFSHLAKLAEDAPAHELCGILWCHCNVSLGQS